MIAQWCSCHPISKAGRSFRVTGCRPNARTSGMNVRRSGMTAGRCEKTSKRLGVREMAPGETFQKVPETCLQPKTAYRLGCVVPGDLVKWFHLQSKPLKLLINLRLGKSWRRRCGTQLQVKGQDRTTCFASLLNPSHIPSCRAICRRQNFARKSVVQRHSKCGELQIF